MGDGSVGSVDDRSYAQALFAEDERGGGDDVCRTGRRRLEVDLGERAGQKFAGAVVDVDFN